LNNAALRWNPTVMPPARILHGEPVLPPDTIGFAGVAETGVATPTVPLEAAARSTNGHARRVAGRGERRWRDVEWIDFTTGDAGDEPAATGAATRAAGTPPSLRFRTGPATPRRRAPEILPGLVARFTRLPAVRPATAPASRLLIAAPTELVIRPRDRMLALGERVASPVIPVPLATRAAPFRASARRSWLAALPHGRRRRFAGAGRAIASAAAALARPVRLRAIAAVALARRVIVAVPGRLSQLGSAIGSRFAAAMRRAPLWAAAIAPRRHRVAVAGAAVVLALAIALLVYRGGAMIAGLDAPRAVPAAAAAPAVPPPAPSDPVARAVYYLARAKGGDPVAQYDVAVLYARGAGLVQDFASAAAWFHAAAVQGNVAAQYDLGVLYERGLGVSPNPVEALDWYRAAAERDHPAAAYNLALALAEGRGAGRDFASAAHWYQRAAVRGVVPAMVNLAILYERGSGVERSPADAYAWYSAAGARGDAEAQRRGALLARQFSGADKHRAEALAAMIAGSIRPAAAPSSN
jgi:TPR repeat protein